ncbi:hypothetical protein CI238_02338 [Colletotrichum incanum]|uniref:Heterokaryon incompatibility domain-containing protein n=1 Tax=Colletotrichum incanum TaxID=1573173 RepID=A0A167A8T0_COLIC|nr:hypothetical protein CI238_02338 [Colletotrichum incanum]
MGRLNLRWPPSVPYTSTQFWFDTLVDDPKTGKESSREYGTESSRALDDSGPSSDDPIYKKALAQDEFRLARLTPVSSGSKNYPVHLSFDVFQDDHHPDYDTVSYTWGGEEDDNRRICPIFVGDYWDILFATRNCAAALRYLRPCRESRLVWVDFVCINQGHTQEKAHQVSKMGRIFSRCNRTILWLGDDVVSHDQTDLSSRYPLHKLDVVRSQGELFSTTTEQNTQGLSEPVGLEKLLMRRYFSRVWVIQELILSPRILIPIGNKVFWAGSLTSKQTEKQQNASKAERQWSWESTSAPWFRLMAHGELHDQPWSKIMALTSHAKASDPRDSLYGVLGLSLRELGADQLIPDYSISYQHMIVGMFAHHLVTRRDFSLLHAARCTSLYESGTKWLPSWVPPFEKQDCWEWIAERVLQQPATRTLDESTNEFGIANKYGGLLHIPYSHFEITAGTSTTGRPWHQQASVDLNTGSLCIWTTKLLTIRSDYVSTFEATQPPLGMSLPQPLYKSYLWYPNAMYVTSKDNLVDLVIEGDELHVLDPSVTERDGKPEEPTFVFLRRVSGQAFILIACVQYVHFCCQGVAGFWKTPLPSIQNSLFSSIKVLKDNWDTPLYSFDEDTKNIGLPNVTDMKFRQILPGNKTTALSAIVPIIVGGSSLEQLLQDKVAQSHRARIVDGYIELTYSAADWATAQHLYANNLMDETGFSIHHWHRKLGDDWVELDSAGETGYIVEDGEDVHIRSLKSNAYHLFSWVDEKFRITGIWDFLGLKDPKGSWEELQGAQSLHTLDDAHVYDDEKRLFGRCGLSGNEAQVYIF